MIASKEQSKIVESSIEGNNITVSAVAGSGKTTTLCMVAENLSESNCLLLTYSRALKDDIHARSIPSNLQAYTFHGYASFRYGSSIYNDNTLKSHIDKPFSQTHQNVPDVLMIDEVQDMTPLYFRLVNNIISWNPEVQLILVGDPHQTIKNYLGARSEFLLNAERLFNSYTKVSRKWSHLTLTTSYRLTPANARFINRHLYGHELIVAGNHNSPNIKPTYLAINMFDSIGIKDIIQNACLKYGHGNVVVLAPSVKVKQSRMTSPIERLIREMTDIPHYVLDYDTEPDKKVTEGKLVFRSYASSKGLEYKCVILFAYDETYFQYNDKKWKHPEKLPNVLTVAATRVKEKLIIVAGNQYTLRSTRDDICDDAYVVGAPRMPRVRSRKEGQSYNKLVTDFIKHRHSDVVDNALRFLNIVDFTDHVNAFTGVNASSVLFKGRYGDINETVSDFYGILIPLMFRCKRTGKRIGTFFPRPDKINTEFIKNLPQNVWSRYLRAVGNKGDYMDLMAATVISTTYIDQPHRARQIDNYKWVDDKIIDSGINALEMNIPAGGLFQVDLEYEIDDMFLSGCASYKHKDIIYMIKYSSASECTTDQRLQLGCYLAMNGGGKGKLVIYPSGVCETVSIRSTDCYQYLEALKSDAPNKSIDDVIKSSLKGHIYEHDTTVIKDEDEPMDDMGLML